MDFTWLGHLWIAEALLQSWAQAWLAQAKLEIVYHANPIITE